MEQIVFEAAAGRLAERNVRVGQPLDQALPAPGATAAVSVTHAGRHGSSPRSCKRPADVSLLHFEETDLSGPYHVKFGPPLAVDSSLRGEPRSGRRATPRSSTARAWSRRFRAGASPI